MATHLGFVAAAVVILSGEVIVKVAAVHVGSVVGGLLTCSPSEGSEGEAIEVGLFVHALSMAADGVLWGEWWTVQQPNTRSAMALVLASVRHQRIGSPDAGHIQIMHSSPHALPKR